MATDAQTRLVVLGVARTEYTQPQSNKALLLAEVLNDLVPEDI